DDLVRFFKAKDNPWNIEIAHPTPQDVEQMDKFIDVVTREYVGSLPTGRVPILCEGLRAEFLARDGCIVDLERFSPRNSIEPWEDRKWKAARLAEARHGIWRDVCAEFERSRVLTCQPFSPKRKRHS